MKQLEKEAALVVEAITALVRTEGSWREKRDAVLAECDEDSMLEEFLAWEWPEEIDG